MSLTYGMSLTRESLASRLNSRLWRPVIGGTPIGMLGNVKGSRTKEEIDLEIAIVILPEILAKIDRLRLKKTSIPESFATWSLKDALKTPFKPLSLSELFPLGTLKPNATRREDIIASFTPEGMPVLERDLSKFLF